MQDNVQMKYPNKLLLSQRNFNSKVIKTKILSLNVMNVVVRLDGMFLKLIELNITRNIVNMKNLCMINTKVSLTMNNLEKLKTCLMSGCLLILNMRKNLE